MTFSIVGRCSDTNMMGVAITTSSICVASRCPWVRAGVGAVATQNVTDPSLGPLLLDDIQSGMSASEAMSKLVNDRENIKYRQLTAVDVRGDTAHFTGTEILGTHSVVVGENCVAAGNLLANEMIAQAMVDQFATGAQMHLAERLLNALLAGVNAGGEEGPTHSAGIKVAHEHSWPLVDLRVDWTTAEPVSQLIEIWRAYEPQVNDYTTRALNPAAAPSYGVPGDL